MRICRGTGNFPHERIVIENNYEDDCFVCRSLKRLREAEQRCMELVAQNITLEREKTNDKRRKENGK